MGSVGLLYVGAVLFLNGMMLLGHVDGRAAAPLNIFVGALQVVTPTYLIFTAQGDADTILAASGLYLFGFTYLYVAFNLFGGLDGTGLGFFSAFVAVCAVIYSALSFGRMDDPAFGVIWLYWAFLWGLFFALLGLRKTGLARYTGAVAAIQGWVTGVLPAFLLLTGNWSQYTDLVAVALAVFGVVAFAALYPRLRHAPSIPEARRSDVPESRSTPAAAAPSDPVR